MPEESTNSDLVEILRHAVEVINRRDVDALLRFYAPDAVWDFSQRGVGIFEGSAAMRGFFKDYVDSFEDFEIELEQTHVLDNGVVLAVVSQEARPVGVAGHVHTQERWVFCFSPAGMIVRLSTYADIDEARAAAERLAEERG
jgi:ketosteroid isomerase-like protein